MPKITEKINTEGFEEQEMSGKCPLCDFDMFFDNDGKSCVIGYGEYPIGGFRNSMKPNTNIGLAYECPKCFTKSIHHTNMESIF